MTATDTTTRKAHVLTPDELELVDALSDALLGKAAAEAVVIVQRREIGRLTQEINKGLCFECIQCDQCNLISECRERATRITLDLLESIPRIRSMLLMDVQAALEGDPAANSADEVILAVDHTKLGMVSVVRLCELDEVDVLVTDDGADEQARAWLGRLDAEVVYAERMQ